MERLFVASPEEMVDVRELMASRHIDDHELAIDALIGWCRVMEATQEPEPGVDHMSHHHWYNRAAGRGSPHNKWRRAHITLIRRDIHSELEAVFGWLNRPLLSEIREVQEVHDGAA